MQEGSSEENNAMKAALKDVSNLRRTEKNKHFETWSFFCGIKQGREEC